MRTALSCLCLCTLLVACSTNDEAAGQGGLTRKDAGGRADVGRETTADSSASVPTDAAEDATKPDASACGSHAGPAADFSVSLPKDVNYVGPVTPWITDGEARQLLAPVDGGSYPALIDGAVPLLPSFATLWANFSRSTHQSNPYNSFTTTNVQVRASERGPVLFETLFSFMAPNTFLGVGLTSARTCSLREQTNTAEPCLTMDFFSITIHGDTDLTLTPASEGHVSIGGIEYVVWLASAQNETLNPDNNFCIADWGPRPGLLISARAVRYEDVLGPGVTDAG